MSTTTTTTTATQPAPSLKERFANPPARFRIMPIVHGLPETPAEQDAMLDKLTERGFGGMVTNVPFKNYLRDEAMWGVFTRSVTEAKKRGMAMWLYDEHGYPSGSAQGQVLEGHPEWQARGLYVVDTVTTQPGPVTITLPPGDLHSAKAYPVANGQINLDQAVDLAADIKEGKLIWTAPAGEWRVMAINEAPIHELTHAAVSLADKLPYINLMRREPTERFLQLTHDAYAAHLGHDLGKYFIATFTDEPSLMSMPMRPAPWRLLPWSQAFAGEFEKRRGYAIEPLLPALAAPAGPRGDRARYDFWLTVGELVAENFFGPIRDWCRQHNIPSGGHLLLEEPLLTQVADYGDMFRCEQMLDAPSLDCLTSIPADVHWYSARLISSAGELIGRYDNMCETSDHAQAYRPAGDTRPYEGVTEDQIRGTCNRLILNGITGITSYYRFKDINDDQLRRLNEWVGRCCAMLYGGHQVADVAVLYPIESAWVHYEPSHNWTQEAPAAAQQVEKIYREATDQLFFHQRDFTFIDARTLAEGKVENGVLKHRDLAWRAIVLPCVDTLPLAAWENLARFWRAGGVVIAVGARPQNSEREFPAPAVEALAHELFPEETAGAMHRNAAGGASILVPSMDVQRLPSLLGNLLDPEVKVEASASQESPLRITHRRIEEHEVFFLINDHDQPWSGTVGLAATGAGEQYDPATGAVTPLPAPNGINLKLGPYSGMLFRFDTPKSPARH